MLDEIKIELSELNAITMLLKDELFSAYQLDEKIRHFEFNRLEDVLITTMGMVTDRIATIDKLVDKLVDEELKNIEGQA